MSPNSDAHYLSKEKYDELVKELELLRTVKRKEIADALEYARSLGDLSENAEYHEAREAQANLEERILTLKEIVKNVQIIGEHHGGNVVELGSIVIVKKKGDNNKIELHIVGSTEADFSKGKLSNESPLGQALLGKRPGDKVKVNTPKGEVEYSVESLD